ncbi:DUF4880 domain-containing protein [Marinomonas ostreistagni]|uniref:DUF4880 domain-containing protein n=1 Tax=Marinomonas ostreistagni TaxID=359209 RepID=UPI00195095F5|nr:DUF4880 domain-containing protein [Marinomonas ostreistagni]MBM6551079.1 DUF4880 domain-containing protein [Marinomonas ostreistagni]
MSTSNSISQQALQQAAEWSIELETQPPCAAFERWRQAAPEHQAAWDKIQRLKARFDSLEQDPRATRVLLNAPERTLERRDFIRRLGALGVLGVGLGWLTSQSPLPTLASNLSSDVHTGVGERQQLATQSGTLWLNTLSAANVSDRQSHVHCTLTSGELAFYAKPSQRVHINSGNTDILCHAGQVSCRQLDDDQLLIANFSGRTQVITPQGQRILDGAQTVRVHQGVISAVRPSQPHHISWTQGRLDSIDLPLATFIHELSRHTIGHIQLDERLTEHPISGSFPLQPVDDALALLAQVAPIKLHQPLPYLTFIEMA